MSFTYTLSTNIGKVRLWIGDTNSSAAVMSDEEINSMLSQNSNDIRATAAACLYAIAASKARLAKMKRAGDYSEDTRTIAKELRDTAKDIIAGSIEPWDETAEQTFGPPDRPFDGEGEKEFIQRENLRNDI